MSILKVIIILSRAKYKITMTRFLLRLGLLLAGVASIVGRNLLLDDFENALYELPDDVELINIGSDLQMLGIINITL